MLGIAPETPYDLRFYFLGIPVRVHPLFWAGAAFLMWNGNDPRFTFIGVLCVFVSIMVHELGHALMGRRFGWEPTIVLHAMGGYATVRQFSPAKNLAVLAAGPLSGLGLYLALKYGAEFAFERGFRPGENLQIMLYQMLFINLVWSLFNLVPVSPLDGGRMVREILVLKTPRNADKYSLLSSIVFSGIIVAVAAYAIQRGEGVFGLEPKFMAIMFALIGIQNFQAYDAQFRRRY